MYFRFYLYFSPENILKKTHYYAKILSGESFMKVIQLENLYEIDYQLKDIMPHYHLWNTSGRWSTPDNGRGASGLMFLFGCEAFYYRNNKLFLHAIPGEIVYLPKKSQYTCVFTRVDGKKETKKKANNFYIDGVNGFHKEFNAINIRFDISDNDNEDIIFSKDLFKIKNFKNAFTHFNTLTSMFSEAKPHPTKIRIRLYQLLNELSAFIKKEAAPKKYKAIISALENIENIDMEDLTVQNITEISGLSPSRFRCLFVEYTGMPPIKFIEQIKSDRAYALLKSGDLSVADVSHLIGINDPAYFSRFYKKITGRNPTDDLN